MVGCVNCDVPSVAVCVALNELNLGVPGRALVSAARLVVRVLCGFAFLVAVIPACLLAEPRLRGIAQPSFRQLARSSGLIFSGTVLSVQQANIPPGSSGEGGAVATTRITFRVEQAIRGVRRGQVVSINEWGGLWQTGERYRVGERALLFLYPRSRLGLTSPVGGKMGRFQVDAAGGLIAGPKNHNHI